MPRPHHWQIHLRYVRYLLWEFRWPLVVFTSMVLLGGMMLRFLAVEKPSFPAACHAAFLLIFMETPNEVQFPDDAHWYLQPLFFLLPLVGLGAVADSVVRLAYLVFTQKSKLQEWHRMVASLHRDHVVVVGVGKVGYRIIRGLLDLREAVVAVEKQGETPFLDEVTDLGVPVIHGDGRNAKVLEQAGVKAARAFIAATSDDLTNLDSALTARDLNPKLKVVLRLFDDTLASKFGGAFSMPAISTARVAAPAFIAAATGRKVYQGFELAGRPVHMVDMTICPSGGLVGKRVGQIQADALVNIVMHSGAQGVNVNPSHDVVLQGHDTILVIAPLERLLELEAANAPVAGLVR
ncbi:MAG: NAD-binding protein [Pirellulales bacterium]|nr:NAD-binding protein [Pirellulales bacterium]